MIQLDDTVRIGYGRFHLPDSHPFYRAAVVHDAWYSQLAAGMSTKTLKQIDKEFYHNCLRIAASEAWRDRNPLLGFRLALEARAYYRVVRAWAKYMRPELEGFRPIDPI